MILHFHSVKMETKAKIQVVAYLGPCQVSVVKHFCLNKYLTVFGRYFASGLPYRLLG